MLTLLYLYITTKHSVDDIFVPLFFLADMLGIILTTTLLLHIAK